MRTYNCKTGDTKPMQATLSYADGSALDLTGATVTFYMGTTIAGGASAALAKASASAFRTQGAGSSSSVVSATSASRMSCSERSE